MHFKNIILALIFGLFALALAACSGDSTSQLYPEIGPNEVVLAISESGGCRRGGHNCRTFKVTRDGTVEVFKVSSREPEIVYNRVETLNIAPERVDGWLADVRETNVKRLIGSFGEGVCNGCSDGIDHGIVILPEQDAFAANTMVHGIYGSPKNVFSDAIEMLREAQIERAQKN